MRLIPLTQGYFAQVDDEDFDRINQWSWYHDSGGYAARDETHDYHKKHIFMQNEIMCVTVKLDHADRNRLNNCKFNLRVCTHHGNMGNSKIRTDNTSGFRGVSFRKDSGKWVAQIVNMYERIYLGLYATPEEAACAYDRKALEIYGEFAYLNFPRKEAV